MTPLCPRCNYKNTNRIEEKPENKSAYKKYRCKRCNAEFRYAAVKEPAKGKRGREYETGR